MAYYLGLMSGTSMDGVDAAVCRFEHERFAGVVGHAQRAYPPELRQSLLCLQRELPALTLAALARLDRAVAEVFAEAALAAVEAAGLGSGDIAALGSHGQTVFHDPEGVGSSLQLGDPNRIAALTGIDTAADFRRMDVALGGHGAPLVPAFHQAVFGGGPARAVVNIGGIANVTLLPAAGNGEVAGFDTGPGNGLMDEWSELQLGQPFDAGGAYAARGRLHAGLLEALLADPYFARPPPKSTGRDQFSLGWVRRRYPLLEHLPPADVQRTFCELSAHSIAAALSSTGLAIEEVVICGGGVRNALLMQRLAALLAPASVRSSAEAGLDPSWVEAAAFAWLAMCRLEGLPGNLPAVTGARQRAVLGALYCAPRRGDD